MIFSLLVAAVLASQPLIAAAVNVTSAANATATAANATCSSGPVAISNPNFDSDISGWLKVGLADFGWTTSSLDQAADVSVGQAGQGWFLIPSMSTSTAIFQNNLAAAPLGTLRQIKAFIRYDIKTSQSDLAKCTIQIGDDAAAVTTYSPSGTGALNWTAYTHTSTATGTAQSMRFVFSCNNPVQPVYAYIDKVTFNTYCGSLPGSSNTTTGTTESTTSSTAAIQTSASPACVPGSIALSNHDFDAGLGGMEYYYTGTVSWISSNDHAPNSSPGQYVGHIPAGYGDIQAVLRNIVVPIGSTIVTGVYVRFDAATSLVDLATCLVELPNADGRNSHVPDPNTAYGWVLYKSALKQVSGSTDVYAMVVDCRPSQPVTVYIDNLSYQIAACPGTSVVTNSITTTTSSVALSTTSSSCALGPVALSNFDFNAGLGGMEYYYTGTVSWISSNDHAPNSSPGQYVGHIPVGYGDIQAVLRNIVVPTGSTVFTGVYVRFDAATSLADLATCLVELPDNTGRNTYVPDPQLAYRWVLYKSAPKMALLSDVYAMVVSCRPSQPVTVYIDTLSYEIAACPVASTSTTSSKTTATTTSQPSASPYCSLGPIALANSDFDTGFGGMDYYYTATVSWVSSENHAPNSSPGQYVGTIPAGWGDVQAIVRNVVAPLGSTIVTGVWVRFDASTSLADLASCVVDLPDKYGLRNSHVPDSQLAYGWVLYKAAPRNIFTLDEYAMVVTCRPAKPVTVYIDTLSYEVVACPGGSQNTTSTISVARNATSSSSVAYSTTTSISAARNTTSGVSTARSTTSSISGALNTTAGIKATTTSQVMISQPSTSASCALGPVSMLNYGFDTGLGSMEYYYTGTVSWISNVNNHAPNSSPGQYVGNIAVGWGDVQAVQRNIIAPIGSTVVTGVYVRFDAATSLADLATCLVELPDSVGRNKYIPDPQLAYGWVLYKSAPRILTASPDVYAMVVTCRSVQSVTVYIDTLSYEVVACPGLIGSTITGSATTSTIPNPTITALTTKSSTTSSKIYSFSNSTITSTRRTSTSSLIATTSSSSFAVATPPPTSSFTISNGYVWKYEGCSIPFTGFVLTAHNPLMTILYCLLSCGNQGFSGISGNACYCSESYSSSSALIAAVAGAVCSTPCPGDPTQFCGGTSLILRKRQDEGVLLSIYTNVNASSAAQSSSSLPISLTNSTSLLLPASGATSSTSSSYKSASTLDSSPAKPSSAVSASGNGSPNGSSDGSSVSSVILIKTYVDVCGCKAGLLTYTTTVTLYNCPEVPMTTSTKLCPVCGPGGTPSYVTVTVPDTELIKSAGTLPSGSPLAAKPGVVAATTQSSANNIVQTKSGVTAATVQGSANSVLQTRSSVTAATTQIPANNIVQTVAAANTSSSLSTASTAIPSVTKTVSTGMGQKSFPRSLSLLASVFLTLAIIFI